MKLRALLFDLDGTLIDTAPDMVASLNAVLSNHGQKLADYAGAAKQVSKGSLSLLNYGLGEKADDFDLDQLKQEFLTHYANNIAHASEPYPGMLNVLDYCEQNDIKWGIVTNKPHDLARDLLEQLGLLKRCPILIGGDSLPEAKPHPMPLLHACMSLNLAGSECIYIGDDERDVIAGNLAGMDTAVALWGYLADQDPSAWNANYLVNDAAGLQTLLTEKLKQQ
jgi:phosphoglycolate phosphatase